MGRVVSDYRHIEMPFGELPPPDVVDQLLEQHMQIRDLMAKVLTSTGEQRQECFMLLVTLLSVHETAEEEVVHPIARGSDEAESAVIDERLLEERSAKELLQQLEGIDLGDTAFDTTFQELRTAVLTHAVFEQRYEFNRLRQNLSPGQRAAMRMLVTAAEKSVATSPHPGLESVQANLVLEPAAAVVDRTRDAIRQARDGAPS